MSGILTKLFDGDEVQKWRTKKFEKTWKKYLTNNKMYDIMNKLLRDSENELNIEN